MRCSNNPLNGVRDGKARQRRAITVRVQGQDGVGKRAGPRTSLRTRRSRKWRGVTAHNGSVGSHRTRDVLVLVRVSQSRVRCGGALLPKSAYGGSTEAGRLPAICSDGRERAVVFERTGSRASIDHRPDGACCRTGGETGCTDYHLCARHRKQTTGFSAQVPVGHGFVRNASRRQVPGGILGRSFALSEPFDNDLHRA